LLSILPFIFAEEYKELFTELQFTVLKSAIPIIANSALNIPSPPCFGTKYLSPLGICPHQKSAASKSLVSIPLSKSNNCPSRITAVPVFTAGVAVTIDVTVTVGVGDDVRTAGVAVTIDVTVTVGVGDDVRTAGIGVGVGGSWVARLQTGPSTGDVIPSSATTFQ
jgi:hypothetical protein